MLRKTFTAIGIALFSLATALPIAAQETATLALRNGERPSGELIDMGAGGFILRINGQDRQFPTSEVAAVEFVVGPLPAVAQARSTRAAGRSVAQWTGHRGTLERRGRDAPVAADRRHTKRSARLQLERCRAASSRSVEQPDTGGGTGRNCAGAAAPIPAGAINVPANQQWTNTGIPVLRGQRISFNAQGDIMISPTASSGPDGSPAVTSPNVRYPLQGVPAGALIGRVGNGAPFPIGGNTQPITMPTNGPLISGSTTTS